jgi:hypothetical protein
MRFDHGRLNSRPVEHGDQLLCLGKLNTSKAACLRISIVNSGSFRASTVTVKVPL